MKGNIAVWCVIVCVCVLLSVALMMKVMYKAGIVLQQHHFTTVRYATEYSNGLKPMLKCFSQLLIISDA